MQRTPEQIMERMRFAVTDRGPYVTELRALIARQVAEGLTDRSAGSWAGDVFPDAEERAKALLSWEWATERGHCCRQEVIDPLIHWTFSTKTMRRGIRIHWRSIPAWVCDRLREAAMRWRVWRDRDLPNPYA